MKICKKSWILIFIIIILSLIIWDNRVNIFGNGVLEREVLGIEKTEGKFAKQISPVIRVVDGDTVILKINGKDERVRLVGLNTPEAKAVNGRVVECFGKEASAKAKEILNGKKVKFEPDEKTTRDKYGRLLGYIFLSDGQNLYEKNFAEIMIEQGYGYEYTYHGRKYKYQKSFKDAQKRAEKNKLGLWGEGICDIIR